jgi:hypothetical protein
MKKFLFFIFLILIMGYGFFQWQNNTYSKEVLKLEILGPDEASLSQEVEYIVRYKNNGDFRLEDPELVFEAPENSIKDGEFYNIQILDSEDLGGAIYPGEERNFSFKVRIFGKKDDIKIAKASLSYRPKDLQARYESSSSISTKLSSSSLTLGFDLPSKAGEDSNFNFKVNYFSNIEYPLVDLRCQIDYPVGFEFVNSSPSALDKTEWDIPVLNKSEGGAINVTGNLSGEIGEAKIFKAKLGMWKDNRFVVLREIERGVEIINPSLYLEQEINGNPEYIASAGELLHYEISFKNVGEEALTNLFMVNQFVDSVLDFESMNSNDGDYQEGDNSIVFDGNNVSKLQYLSPLEEGSVEFWIRVKEDLGNIKNPAIKNNIFIGQSEESFTTKIKPKLVLDQKAYYENDIFSNNGPLPPEVGDKTSYTVVWRPKTFYSNVENVKVKTFLPDNVDLIGDVFPEDQLSNFTFNSDSREIVWTIGNLQTGENSPTIAFQVELEPNSSQRGEKATIIEETIINGYDLWTETNIENEYPALDSGDLVDYATSTDQGIIK